ncbi:MAG: HDIG domain-containing metalloprotein [Candidatus Hydrothermia bacterium]
MKSTKRVGIQRIKKKASERTRVYILSVILLLFTLYSINKIISLQGKDEEPPSSLKIVEFKIQSFPYFVKRNPPEIDVLLGNSPSYVDLAVYEFLKNAYARAVLDDAYTGSQSSILVNENGIYRWFSIDSVSKISEIKRGIDQILSEFQIDSAEKELRELRYLSLLSPTLVPGGIKEETTKVEKNFFNSVKNTNPFTKEILLNLYLVVSFLILFLFIHDAQSKSSDKRKAVVLILSYITLIAYPLFSSKYYKNNPIYLFPLPILLTAFLTGIPLTFLLGAGVLLLLIPALKGNLIYLLFINSILLSTSAYFGSKIKKPWDYLEAFLGITLSTILLYTVLNYQNLSSAMADIKTTIIITGISMLLFILLHPILEKILRYPSIFTLTELTNMSHPLLQKLQSEAPGTFEHSLRVAELGARAAGCIGLNPYLARACGLYHDIGKIMHPVFFIENQVSGENPHDKISPEMSVQILKSHVIDGINLAKQYKLPDEIIRVIATHHGTSVMMSLYKKSLSQNPQTEKNRFRYSGPKPRTKLEGIFMIVDGVEAASRVLEEKTEERFSELVSDIIKEKIEDGQFAECELTYAELEQIKRELVKALISHYHLRIKYYEDKGY